MHYSAGGLYIAALGSSVVFIGLVLLGVAVGVIYFLLNRRRSRARRPAETVVSALPAAEVAPGLAPAAGGADSEAVAAVAACLACVMDGRLAEEAGPAGLSASLVAAMTAAIMTREEAGESPWSGRISIKVQKGAPGMRKFKVVVNGKEYNVEVTEVSEVQAPVAAAAPVPAPTPAPGPASTRVGPPEPAAPATAAGGSPPVTPAAAQAQTPPSGAVREVEAPLAGTILSVRVKEGDRVKVGDVLVTLEALKLENEIASPYCGVVRSVNVSAGESVRAGAVLVTVEEITSQAN